MITETIPFAIDEINGSSSKLIDLPDTWQVLSFQLDVVFASSQTDKTAALAELRNHRMEFVRIGHVFRRSCEPDIFAKHRLLVGGYYSEPR
jgi:hypothetical protein